MEVAYGETVEATEQGCTTPKTEEYRIPAILECPPAPRKKKPTACVGSRMRQHNPPKNGYFQSADLDALFGVVAMRREAWA